MKNPFKFASLVDTPYFTDRVKELDFKKRIARKQFHCFAGDSEREIYLCVNYVCYSS